MDTTYTTLDWKMMAKIFFAAPDNKLDLFMDATQYGDVIKTKGMHCRYFLNDPAAIYHVLVKNADNYTKEDTSFMRVKDIIGVGQLTSVGEAWASSRKQMQPHFYYNNLSQAFPIINDCTDRLIERWEKYAKKRIAFNVVEEMSAVVLEISTALLFGQKVPFDPFLTVRRFRYANNYIATTSNLWKYKPTLPNFRYQNAKRFIRQLCHRLVEGPHDHYANLSPLLSPIFLDGGESPEAIEHSIGEATNYLLAGHDTTASALSWAFYCLNGSPTTHDFLIEEASTVLGTGPVTLEKYEQLTNTLAIIQETLRLFPSVWSMERSAIEDDQIGPMSIQAGSYMFICPYTMHRHPSYWHSPNEFNIHHFSAQQTKERPKCAYIPFGMGPRVCIGKHLALMIATSVLAKIAQRYHFRLDTRKEILVDPLLTLKPSPDIKIKIQEMN